MISDTLWFQPAPERTGSVAGDQTERRPSVGSNAALSEHSHHVEKGGKEGGEVSVQSYTITQQAKNYFKSVSENKEIAKLASLLSTSINSNKKVGEVKSEREICFG